MKIAVSARSLNTFFLVRRRRGPKVHVYRFRKRAYTEVYHPPAGKQLPTSCLGRFLRPALTFAFLPSLLSSSFLPFMSCPLAADRPRDAIRARREWDQDGGQVHLRLAALVARALPLFLLLPSLPASPVKPERCEIFYCRV